MNTRAYKEYEPVRYPENGVKVLYDARVEPGAKAFPLHWHERMELIRTLSSEWSRLRDNLWRLRGRRFHRSRGISGVKHGNAREGAGMLWFRVDYMVT